MANGEYARLLRHVPMKMQVVDNIAVLLPFSHTGTAGAILFTGGPIPCGMFDYFERLWKISIPYKGAKPPPGCPLTELQLQILQLMASGKTDQAIAEAIGYHKSKVEREMDQVEELVDLNGRRFALAVELGRRGWIPGEKGD